ncbi:MAG: class I SAM-dependent methyltransferase [Burkholderiaceae bacterium]
MEELPIPDTNAQQSSDELQARLRARVQSAGGWLGFDQFMNSALYEPVLGYYSGGSRRFGPDGDFVTAPELTPLFGHCVAQAMLPWLQQTESRVIEFGAGTGQLAAQVLNALDRVDQAPAEYLIVELSAALRAQQQHTLNLLAPELAGRVRWLDELPALLEGVVLANEVLDAMPVRLFELSDGAIMERGLVRGRGDAALAWQARRADESFERAVRQTLARSQWGGDDHRDLNFNAWPDQYTSELGEQATAWVRTLGERLSRGVMLFIDYGFPAGEYFHPQRATGTLACHYRHRVHHDPLWNPGLQDITAHVDFSAIAYAAERVGLEVLGYTSQANFLLNTGLLEGLSHLSAEQTVEYARQAQAVQRLVSEAEMGELFKVIALSRGVVEPGGAFGRGDRSAVLGVALRD